MKKMMKKLGALTLVVCLLMQMTVSVWAETPADGSIEITFPTGSTGVKNFYGYLLVEGTPTSYKLTENVDFQPKIAAALSLDEEDENFGKNVLDLLDGVGDNSSAAITYSYALQEQFGTSGNSPTPTFTMMGNLDANLTIKEENLEYGYYLVIAQLGVHPPMLIKVENGTAVKVEPKSEVPLVDKKIFHNEKATSDNDDPFTDEGENSDAWGNVGDNQMGEDVYFRVTTNIPDKIAGFDGIGGNVYYQVLKDVMPADQFAYEEANFKMYIGETLYENSQHTDKVSVDHDEDATGGTVGWEVKFSLDDKDAALLGKTVTIEYTAKLLNTANYGKDHNTNTVTLTYSKYKESDNWDGSTPPIPSTPEEEKNTGGDEITVYDYTFATKIEKVDGEETPNPLANAKFTLHLTDGSGNITEPLKLVVRQAAVTDDENPENNKTAIYAIDDSGTTTTIETDATGIFTIVGLDDQVEYAFVETEAPPEHEGIKTPFHFTITAGYDSTGKTLTDLTTDYNNDVDGDGTKQETDGVKVTTNTDPGEVEAVVVNIANDYTLPTTGGMGTVAFYVVGGGLVLAAGALLILKKKNA